MLSTEQITNAQLLLAEAKQLFAEAIVQFEIISCKIENGYAKFSHHTDSNILFSFLPLLNFLQIEAEYEPLPPDQYNQPRNWHILPMQFKCDHLNKNDMIKMRALHILVDKSRGDNDIDSNYGFEYYKTAAKSALDAATEYYNNTQLNQPLWKKKLLEILKEQKTILLTKLTNLFPENLPAVAAFREIEQAKLQNIFNLEALVVTKTTSVADIRAEIKRLLKVDVMHAETNPTLCQSFDVMFFGSAIKAVTTVFHTPGIIQRLQECLDLLPPENAAANNTAPAHGKK